MRQAESEGSFWSWRHTCGVLVGGSALLMMILGLLCAPAPADEDAPEAQPPRTFALLIGCTEYPMLKDNVTPEAYQSQVVLDGCVNDVLLLERTLRERFGVPAENITALKGWAEGDAAAATRPTRQNILGALAGLAAKVREGDRVIVHYAGHGDRIPDDDGDEADKMDEVIMPADVDVADDETWYVNCIRDDEMYEALGAIRDAGALVWLIMDCCHSATGMRGFGERETKFRKLSREDLGPVGKGATRSVPRSPGSKPGSSPEYDLDRMVAFYAAQSYQPVPEVEVPLESESPKSHGLLTYVVAQALQRAGEHTTFRDLYQQVVGGYYGLRQNQRVQPLAEGDLARKVRGEGVLPGPALSVQRAGQRLVLNAGSIWGVAPGAVLTVYAPGERGNDDAKVGTVVVSSVELDSALCETQEGRDEAWLDAEDSSGVWPAEVRDPGTGAVELPVAVLDASGATVELSTLPKRVEEVFLDNKGRFPIAEATRAHWHLVVGDPKEDRETRALVHLSPARGGAPALRFNVKPKTLESHLLQALRAENLLRVSLERKAGQPRPRFSLNVQGGDGQAVKAGAMLTPGQTLQLTLFQRPTYGATTAQAKAYDVYVFWVDAHYGIWQIFPPEGVTPRRTFEEERPELLTETVLSDEHPGMETFLVFARPITKTGGAGDLNLEFLATPPMELVDVMRTHQKGPEDEVVNALRGLAFGRNARGPVPNSAARAGLTISSFSWTTGWGDVKTPDLPQTAPSAQLAEAPAVRAAPTAGSAKVPGAWSFGTDVCLGRAGDDYCLLVAQGDGAEHLLLDLDGTVGVKHHTAKALAQFVQEKQLDPELALRFEADGTRTIWYDTDNDGEFDLILVDTDRMSPEAEVRYVRGDKGWTRHEGDCVDFLSTRHLKYLSEEERATGDYGPRTEALRRLRAFFAD